MQEPSLENLTVAVIIPCYQEELTIGKVVEDFQRALPSARIYVYDNNCTDATAAIAKKAGAIVRRETKQGKGFVVASMFEQVDADILVMVDGDDTYDAAIVGALLEPVLEGDADMTVATRLHAYGDKSFRKFHLLGNRLVCAIINWMFKSQITDIFSGYRAFTREAASLIPITAHGFDVETELTLQALYRGLVIKELPASYRARPEGSFSKIEHGLRRLSRHPETVSDLEILQAAHIFWDWRHPAFCFGHRGRLASGLRIYHGAVCLCSAERDFGGGSRLAGFFQLGIGVDP